MLCHEHLRRHATIRTARALDLEDVARSCRLGRVISCAGHDEPAGKCKPPSAQ